MLSPCVWLAVKHAIGFVGDASALTLPATGEEVLRCLGLPKPDPRDGSFHRGFLPEDVPAERWTGAPDEQSARR